MSLNPFWLFLIAGVALVAIEMVVFQFTTFWLLFIGLGALVAAAYAWLTVDPTYTATIAVFLIASSLITAVLFAPIRRWQNAPSAMPGNDTVGQVAIVTETISTEKAGSASWSGSDWQAELAPGITETLVTGQSVSIVSVEGIRLLVAPK